MGGIRSALPVDANHLRPYYYSVLLCMNITAWQYAGDTTPDAVEALRAHVRLIDLSTIEDTLRGFSEALRVGRYAYLAPLSNAESTYSAKLIRISLGEVDIGTTLAALEASGTNVRTIVDILDLSKKSQALRGYSGLFTAGRNLFLVPFRNAYEPRNGQRGHGSLTRLVQAFLCIDSTVVFPAGSAALITVRTALPFLFLFRGYRLNLNDFSISGVDFIDIPTTIRTQVPSFPDFKLRGYWGGFASTPLLQLLLTDCPAMLFVAVSSQQSKEKPLNLRA